MVSRVSTGYLLQSLPSDFGGDGVLSQSHLCHGPTMTIMRVEHTLGGYSYDYITHGGKAYPNHMPKY